MAIGSQTWSQSWNLYSPTHNAQVAESSQQALGEQEEPCWIKTKAPRQPGLLFGDAYNSPLPLLVLGIIYI